MPKRPFLMVFLSLVILSFGEFTLGEEGKPDDEGKPLYEIGIGASFLSIPDYRGSDDENFHVLPFPFIIYRGDFIKADGRSVKGVFFSGDKLEINLSVDASPPVESEANGAREGMNDLDPTIEFGPNITYQVLNEKTEWGEFKLDLRFSLRRIIATDIKNYAAQGWVFHPRINIDYLSRQGLLKDWSFGLSAGPLFGTAKFHGYYYDVDQEFEKATRPTFKSGGGYSGTRLTGTLSRRFGQYWFGAFMRTDFLDGARFEASPLVERRTSIMGGFGIAWIFYQSTEKVYK